MSKDFKIRLVLKAILLKPFKLGNFLHELGYMYYG